MSFAMFTKAAAVAAILAVAGSGAQAQMQQQGQQQVRSPQVAFALLFLSRLENSHTFLAHKMLAPNVAREVPVAKLASASPRRSKIPVHRQVRSESIIPLGLAYANKLSEKRTGRGIIGVTAYSVCFADVPKSGYGRITYIHVVLLQARPGSKLQISEFRYQSEPDVWCQ